MHVTYSNAAVTNVVDLTLVKKGKWWYTHGFLEPDSNMRKRVEDIKDFLIAARRVAAKRPVKIGASI